MTCEEWVGEGGATLPSIRLQEDIKGASLSQGCVTLYKPQLWLVAVVIESVCLIPSVLICQACTAHARVVLGHGRRVLVK